MKTAYKSSGRGRTHLEWLDSWHSFSFGDFYDENMMQFGALRVLNDDTIAAGKGFGSHPHDNMEIISIGIEGELAHRDSIGNEKVISSDEIQVMSAGTGVVHSEYNHSKTHPARFLQIWITPREQGISPRYDQKKFKLEKNVLAEVVSGKIGDSLFINQDASLFLGEIEKGKKLRQSLKKGNGAYIFLIEGKIKVEEETLSRRDALAVWDVKEISIAALENSRILLIEVPME